MDAEATPISGGTCMPIREIKGAARRSVRPKSREETPKEGNETNELVVGLASSI